MVYCEICGKGMMKITTTHTKSKHGMTTREYMKRFPGAPMLDVEVIARFVSKTKGRKNTDEMKVRMREKKLTQYREDPSLRERVSEGTKRGMAEPGVKERHLRKVRDRYTSGGRSSFFGRHHTEETRRVIAENEERNAKIAEKKSEWWESRQGQTVEQIYGEEIGQRMRLLKSERMSGEQNPAFGKVYEGSGRGHVGRYKGLLFRSTYEYSYYKHLEATGVDLMTVQHETLRIPYILDGKKRTYIPDFVVRNEIVEIKPNYIVNGDDQMFLAKKVAAEVYCIEHGMTYRVLTEDDFPIIRPKDAFLDPNVVWLYRGPKER